MVGPEPKSRTIAKNTTSVQNNHTLRNPGRRHSSPPPPLWLPHMTRVCHPGWRSLAATVFPLTCGEGGRTSKQLEAAHHWCQARRVHWRHLKNVHGFCGVAEKHGISMKMVTASLLDGKRTPAEGRIHRNKDKIKLKIKIKPVARAVLKQI